MEEFRKLGLSEDAIRALKKKGFTRPTAVQSKVIPLLLAGKKDVVAQSQTGTGKTAGFALPILERIRENSKTVQAIILTPTRELALQVSKEIYSLKGDKDIKVLAVYGGSPIGPQRKRLHEGVDIVVGTPGRVMDLQHRGSLKLDNIQYAVLDEADEMLNMGFVEDIENILQQSPKDKKMLLFSATIPKPILKIAKKYMREYELIEIEKSQIIINTVEQIYYNINAKDRIEALRRVLDFNIDFYGIIFCSTKATVDNLAQKLKMMGYSCAALHGDITQSQREKILEQFKTKQITILVATDVAARGIDVNDLTHVVNFSLPQSPESYVHRIGRTGRAGKKGIAITFVIPSERRMLGFVERVNNCKLMKQRLPSVQRIHQNREAQIKTIISDIIESGKSTKYDKLAEELLRDNHPGKLVSAVLQYSFKNELEVGQYKVISEPKESRGSDRAGYRGGGRRHGRSSGKFRGKGGSGDKRSKKGKKTFGKKTDKKERKFKKSSFGRKKRR